MRVVPYDDNVLQSRPMCDMRRYAVGLFARSSGILWFSALLAGLPAQVEVLDSGSHPSEMLDRQIKKGEDDFVLYDSAFPIREAVVWMHRTWYEIERARREDLTKLLASMASHLGKPAEGPAADVASAVEVGRALLAGSRDLPPGPARDELLEVLAGGRGRLRFTAPPSDWDCSLARPQGSYGLPAYAEQEKFAGLFRATVYLRTYLGRWSAVQRDLYCATAKQCLDATSASRLPESDAKLRGLFGSGALAPGIPLADVAPDFAFFAANGKGATAALQPWQLLGAMFSATVVEEPRSVRDHAINLAHTLAMQKADHEVFRPLGAHVWRAKWFDAAAFTYVGLREIDALYTEACDRSRQQKPRIVIEPVPAVWAAIARLEAGLWSLSRGPAWVQSADPVLEALAVQQRGEDLTPEVEAMLLERLCIIFGTPDLSLGCVTSIEGLGRVRRAPVQLVRIPIQWRGVTRRALALRLHVERETESGDWQAPPWGAKFDPDVARKWFPEK